MSQVYFIVSLQHFLVFFMDVNFSTRCSRVSTQFYVKQEKQCTYLFQVKETPPYRNLGIVSSATDDAKEHQSAL